MDSWLCIHYKLIYHEEFNYLAVAKINPHRVEIEILDEEYTGHNPLISWCYSSVFTTSGWEIVGDL